MTMLVRRLHARDAGDPAPLLRFSDFSQWSPHAVSSNNALALVLALIGASMAGASIAVLP